VSAIDADRATRWRDPGAIVGHWLGTPPADPRLFKAKIEGAWWDIVRQSRQTLLVSREYEHLLVACSAVGRTPLVTYLPVPHPSGITVDGAVSVLVASTRNPNQIYQLSPVSRLLDRTDADVPHPRLTVLVPTRTDFYPGCLYIHDVALIGGRLYASAAGQNAIVELSGNGRSTPVWWPKAIDQRRGPLLERNHLQLNSIAAGSSLKSSFFTASAAQTGHRRPGHRNFAVDRRGVVFSGRSREPIATGLTRPHSARLHDGRVWVLNSGYGEFGYVEDGSFEAVCRLPGWTRGLGFAGRIAFVGTSRILPRFTAYAPGLDPSRSVCGIHAVDTRSGVVVGSIVWPNGDQIFAVEPIPAALASALPFRSGIDRRGAASSRLFYAFQPVIRAGSERSR
jgi:uncharacterized protein (TIGR03032 family)